VDGSSSASNSDTESFERISPPRPSDTERELNVLRARAYGPEPDIDADPGAMARLIELETAHVAVTSPLAVTPTVEKGAAGPAWTSAPAHDPNAVSPAAPKREPLIPTTAAPPSGRSLWLRPTLTLRREWFVLGSIVVAGILGSAAWLLAPQSEATLHPDAALQLTESETESSSVFVETLIAHGENPDISTLRQFERYHDIDVWSVQVSSVENSSGNTCLTAWDRMGGRFQYDCLATGLEVAVHMTVVAEADDRLGEWLADGSIISLHLRENTVDVYVHAPPAAP
jgi:hypothetical protein